MWFEWRGLETLKVLELTLQTDNQLCYHDSNVTLVPFVQETNFKQFWKEEKKRLRGYLVYHGRLEYSQGTSV